MKNTLVAAASAAFALTVSHVNATFWNGSGIASAVGSHTGTCIFVSIAMPTFFRLAGELSGKQTRHPLRRSLPSTHTQAPSTAAFRRIQTAVYITMPPKKKNNNNKNSIKKQKAKNHGRDAPRRRDKSLSPLDPPQPDLPPTDPSRTDPAPVDAEPTSGDAKKHERFDSALSGIFPGDRTKGRDVSWSKATMNWLTFTQPVSASEETVGHPEPPPNPPRLSWAQLAAQVRWHDLIILAIWFCIIFGGLWGFVGWLLKSIPRANAQSCAPSTVFVPVTQNMTTTYTVYSYPTFSDLASQTPSTDLTTVLLTTVVATTTVTADASIEQAAVSSSSPYIFSVVDSTTLWAGGVSPTSGAKLSISTSVVTVSPVDATAAPELTTWSTISSTSTLDTTTTITLPAETTTEYSLLSTLSTTLTSTHYVTQTLDDAPSRSSFSGIDSAGWNATSTQTALTQTSPELPAMTTLTDTHFFVTGNITTSTSTNRITTTMGALLSPTTITAPTVTVTYTVENQSAALSSSSSASTDVGAAATSAVLAPPTSALSPITTQPGLPLASTYTPQFFSSPSADASSTFLYPTGAPIPTMPSSSGSVIASAVSSAAPAGLTSAAANVSGVGLPTPNTSPTLFSVTSFLSGLGTTLTLTSNPDPTTPMSTSAGLPTPPSSVEVFTIASFLSGSGYTLTTTLASSLDASVSAPSSDGSTAPLSTGMSSGATFTSRVATESASSNTTTSAGESFTATQPSVVSGSSLSGGPPSPASSISSPGASSVSHRSSSIASLSASATNARSVTSRATVTFSSTSQTGSSLRTLRSSSSFAESRNSTTSASATTETISSSFATSFTSSSNAAPSATSTQGCGEQGNFTMGFDDLPAFHPQRSVKRNSRRQSNATAGNDISRQPPLDLRPYHHMTFSNGFVYAPQPVEPFTPISQPNVAAFLASGTGMRTGSQPSESGEIGDGPARSHVPAFWFDAYNAFFGCDNAGPGNCTVEVTGMHFDPVAKDETPAFSQNYTLPPCAGNRNCVLTPVSFPSTARNLSGLEIRAIRNGEPRRFFMDDFHAAWSDKSCEAGLLRESTH